MANQGYRPGVSRAITKKWAEAKAINYDDWDDSDGYDPEEPVQTVEGHGRQQSWDTRSQGGRSNPPGQYYPSNRSVTGPPSTGRASFDQGDDRRHYANLGGAQGPYPTAQRDPFDDIQHERNMQFDPQGRGPRGQPSLSLQTGGRPSMEHRPYQQGPYAQGPYTAGPGGHHFQDPRGAPFSAPIIGPSGHRSQSSGRPAPGEGFPSGESPMRPPSQNSHGGSPNRAFPPRKSSLSQSQPPPEIQQYGAVGAAPIPQTATPPTEVKALPFIRPADIYKRMEEERERERRSQESSRPSMDSGAGRVRETPAAGDPTAAQPSADSRATGGVEEPDSARKLQTTLPPVAERKSEYGFENIAQTSHQGQPATLLNRTDTDMSKASAASSDYTNRPDPTSASTLNSRQSPFDFLAETSHQSAGPVPPNAPFQLPAVRGVSDFGNEIFGQRDASSSLPESQPSTIVAASRGEDRLVVAPLGSNLQHQNTAGYRSMVDQAFDQSQEQVPPTPISISDSVARSNSASASDISPIVSRSYEPPASQPTIPEESGSRPGTSGTQHSGSRSVDKDLPAPPAIVPGYRRDGSPTPSDNPDKRPLSITTANIPKSEHAIPSAGTASTASWDKDSVHAPDVGDDTILSNEAPMASAGNSMLLNKPSELSRTASEDYREWDDTRKQFKTHHGVQDSIPSTPGMPSPISRVESPSKGTVRDIAHKLESNSGTNSPVGLEPMRPSNARLDSFRPSLPGGWQSYSTNAGQETPQAEAEPQVIQPTAAVEREEDYPKAGPPRDHSTYTRTSNAAFQSLAASGSALAGAFGLSQAAKEQSRSQNISVENSRSSTSMSSNELDETPMDQDRQLETIPEGDHRSPTSPAAPAPLPKDTPSESNAGRSTLDYFPAPLTVRPSRGEERLAPQRPALEPTLSTENSPHDDDNDRLRKEIVKSLTPKSSRFEDGSTASATRDNFLATSGSQRTVSTVGDSNLPKEYDSYWNDSTEKPSDNSMFKSASSNIPPVPQLSESGITQAQPAPETKAVHTNAAADIPPKTTLDQRFSWETAEGQTPPISHLPPREEPRPGQGSPETIRAATFATTSAPTVADSLGSSAALHPAPSAKVQDNKNLPEVVESHPSPMSSSAHTPVSPISAFKERPVKDVLALSSPRDRIQAFDAHRQHYATNEDGGLARWLQTVGSAHPEHAPVMSANGMPTIRDDGTELHRPSPARMAAKFRMPSSNYTGGGETSGTKQIQEDGKRLLQAGGKLGKKGGLAAKGLLAKAKDKARAVSSSDKGSLQTRRRSSQIGAASTEDIQHSTTPSEPPQIPSPKLEISPVDHDDWSLPYGSPRDEKKPEWNSVPPFGTSREVGPSQISEAASTAKYEAPGDQPRGHTATTGVVEEAASSNKEHDHRICDSTQSSINTAKAENQTLEALGQRDADTSHVPHEHHTEIASIAGIPVAAAAAGAENKYLAADSTELWKRNSLAAPQDSNSVISNVSSPSANPDRSRSISPPRRSISNQKGRDEANAPAYTQHFPPTKSAEAEAEKALNESRENEEQLPTYQQPMIPAQAAPSRLGENPQIIPVADLSSKPRDEGKPIQPRPFSFAGPEALDRRSADSPYPSSIGGTLLKQESNVEVTEVTDDLDGAKNSKSFHRPFGTGQEPNVHEHPAYRNPDAAERSQMYSTENPLPSARRNQPSPVAGQYSNASQQRAPQEGEEGYRIPGPYVQEYRSPANRQNAAPYAPIGNPVQGARYISAEKPEQRTMDLPSQGARYMPAQQSDQWTNAPPHPPQGRQMGPPLRPDDEKMKSRTFGGLFKREKSHTKDQTLKPKKEKRESFFGRQDSVSSQGSRLGSLRQSTSREQPYRQESRDGFNTRRTSKDMRRSSTGLDDESGRKKRFSGIGGFFSKSPSNASKSAMNSRPYNAPMQQSTYQESRERPQQIPQQQTPYAAGSMPDRAFSGRPVHERPYHLQTTNSHRPGNAAAVSGYDGYEDRQYSNSAFPHGPDSIMSGGRGIPIPNQTQDRNFDPTPFNTYNASSQTQVPAYDPRPANLRINTGPNSGPPPHLPTPSTMSSGGRNALSPSANNTYNTQPYPVTRAAPNASTSAGSGSASASATTNRAIDLHKRSRSPKLGRHSSSEDLTQQNDPAAHLGTFSASRSPHSADPNAEVVQEKPWAISLPAEHDEEGSGNKVLQRSESAGNRGGAAMVAELPGSKATGYESEEEIVMSATAMPGEMWMPDAMDYAHGRYDD